MYAAFEDPNCYPGSDVLKNRAGLRSQAALDLFEVAATGRRFNEPMPVGHFGINHYKAVHRNIFQDVYPWAGRFRTIRISRGGSTLCFPENTPAQLRRTFDWLKKQDYLRHRSPDAFAAGAAHFAAEVNAIHAFRDGNGRTQLAFLALLAIFADHPLRLERLDPTAFLAAMILSFHGDEGALRDQLAGLAGDPNRRSRRSSAP